MGNLETSELASYVLAVLGLALLGWAVWSMKAIGIDRHVGNAVMMKTLSSGNTARAEKFCAAAPGSYFDAVRAAIAAALATGSRDLTMLDAAARPAFDAKALEVASRWRRLLEAGTVGVMMIGAAIAIASQTGVVPLVLWIAGGLAMVTGGWLLLRRRRVHEALEAARLELVPAVIKAIIDGPHADAPPARASAPVRTPSPAAAGSLRDGACPLCKHTTIKQVERASDPRFHTLVCAGCGYTQEFADPARLDT